MSNRLISEILNEPHAYLLIQAIEVALENEKQRRIAFYNDITEQEKAEFINGEIVVHSPVMMRRNNASLLLAQLMKVYAIKHQLGFVGIEKIIITLTRNDYERPAASARHLFLQKRESRHFYRKANTFSRS